MREQAGHETLVEKPAQITKESSPVVSSHQLVFTAVTAVREEHRESARK